MDTEKVISLVKKGEIEFVDLRFTDLRGTWQHMTVPAPQFTTENIKKGFGFDGSSIKGFNTIFESDMILKPDLATLFIDPFYEKTAAVICNIFDPDTENYFVKDPRWTAMKAEKLLQDSGIGDISYWGPEIEFFVFRTLDISLSPYFSLIEIAQDELPGEDGQSETADGYRILNKSGYFPVPPFDRLMEFRSEMVRILQKLGFTIEFHHHEVSTGGQVEIDIRYDTLLKMADNVMIYKYVARNLASRYGMTACFLPKPVYGDNGSGMHTHQSIFKKGKNIFFDPKGYGEVSKSGLNYAAGLLSNVESILGITNPTINSYRRLVPHFEAPTSIAFSKRNRSAAIRIPMYYKNMEKSKRLEFRCPDPTCNPYLSFAAQLVCGLDGIKRKLDPTKLGYGPFDENIWEKGGVKQTPNNLFTTLDYLEKNTVLTTSNVFAKDLMASYIEVKREEARQVMLYPTPSDFWFYGDI